MTDGAASVDGAPVVLFLCVHNAGRSQMARAFLAWLAGGQVVALAAGSDPAAEVNPVAVRVMLERGIDIAREVPRRWTEDDVRTADLVVTMGCGDTCPYVPGTRYLDWDLDDPAGRDVEAVRVIRDAIEHRVRGLLADLDIQPVR